ncbi:MAG: hypothetical protein R3F65_06005 [bacterium]
MIGIQDVTGSIRDIVAEHGSGIVGSQLAARMRDALGDWNPRDYGARNLRHFIAMYVTDVKIAGRSGLDVLYSVQSVDSLDEESYDRDSHEERLIGGLWRVWVSPSSPFCLLVDRRDGSVEAVSRETEGHQGRVVLLPPSVETHRHLARLFLPRVPKDWHEHLLTILGDYDDRWWRRWLSELRRAQYLEQWQVFRKHSLLSLLIIALQENGFDIGATVAATARIANGYSPDVKLDSSRDSEANIRRVASDVVQKLTLVELRGLHLPLGLVLDSLTI